MSIKKSAANSFLALSGMAALGLGACASDSIVLTGAARPPIPPSEVRIYSHPPAAFEEIAILNTSKSSAFTTGGQKTVDKVIAGLKKQAAKQARGGPAAAPAPLPGIPPSGWAWADL